MNYNLQDLESRSNLTRNQLLTWISQKLQPGLAIFHNTILFKIPSEIDLQNFRTAFQSLINASDVFRTIIDEIDGIPQQTVKPQFAYTVEFLDWTNLKHKEKQLHQWAQERCKRPFDFKEPLFDTVLLKISDDEYVWYLNQHQILFDGWATALSYRYISEIYQYGFTENLVDVKGISQFEGYVKSEHDYRKTEKYHKDEAYWSQKLSQDISPIQFYGNSCHHLTTAVERISVKLGVRRTQALKRSAADKNLFGNHIDSNLFHIFTICLSAYLYRVSGNRQLRFGVPFHNRHSKTLKATIGMLMHVLPFDITIEKNDTFLSLVKKAESETFGNLRHRNYTIANPLVNKAYDVILNYQNVVFPNFNGTSVKSQWIHPGHANESLGIQIYDFDGENNFSIDFAFNRDVFTPRLRRQAIQHFLNVIDAFLENPNSLIDRVNLLSGKEKERILFDFNQAQKHFPNYKTIHRLFEEQAQKTPNAIAVVFKNQQLNYTELNRKSNQLAHYLRNSGISRETRIGICLERSLDAVICVLGVLKTGGTYIPLEPIYPAERLNFMIKDSQAAIILTQKNVQPKLDAKGTKVVCIDTEESIFNHENDENLPGTTSPDYLAYVIYTSGSTGNPKGVMVSHASLVNAYYAWEDAYQLTSEARAHLQMANFSFDVFTGDWVRALCSGGKLVLCPPEYLFDAEHLYQLMLREGVDCAEFVPSVLRNLVGHLETTGERLEFMRLLICGSDSWYVKEYKKFLRFCGPATRLINSYGLTEATIDSCYFEASQINLPADCLVPIGKPFANTRVYILDENLQLVPPGVPGELYIGGKGLAKGYFNRPQLTAEKFIPNPFENFPGEKLYKTGDLARFLPDGNIEFLGRLDAQVKIRGLRIEPGEIEAALNRHPRVKDVLITTVENEPSDMQLAAYVVPGSSPKPGINELHDFLKTQLPDYMIPHFFVFLEALPLLPNGKINRKALPPPQSKAAVSENVYTAPVNKTQRKLARIWSEVLGVKKIGIYDDFFQYGGDSLSALLAITRIRKTLNVEISIKDFFKKTTIASLAELIDKKQPTLERSFHLQIGKFPKPPRIPLSAAQEQLWFLAQLEPGNPNYNLGAALRLEGALDIKALRNSLQEIVERHEILRTAFAESGGKPFQIIKPAFAIDLPVINLETVTPEDANNSIDRHALQEAQHHFDLSQGPLFRFKLLKVDEEHHVLLISAHHIIMDGWSFGVFFKELMAFYNAFLHKRNPSLPPLLIQYSDFAVWQAHFLQSKNYRKQLAFWKEYLGVSPPQFELPGDTLRREPPSYCGKRKSIHLSKVQTEKLRALGRQEGATLQMVVFTIFNILLFCRTHREDIIIGMVNANRKYSELEPLLGFFVNMLPIKTTLSNETTFLSLLKQVKKNTLAALAHQEVPFETLIRELQPQRAVNRNPLCQIAFAFQNFMIPELRLKALSTEGWEVYNETSKFDLVLFINETAQGLHATIEYDTGLFEAATVDASLTHFKKLAEKVAANPDTPIRKLNSAKAAQRYQPQEPGISLISQFEPLPTVFERKAAQTPEALALEFPSPTPNSASDIKMTYSELNRRANQLARYLKKLGVDNETLVGICLGQSPDAIISMLAILKAGGAYVPLDPAYPKERLGFMLKDARMPVLITQTALLSNLPEYEGRTILLDSHWEQIAGEDTENLNASISNEQLAYVMYTSGSTGQPKGVCIPHRAIHRLVINTNYIHLMPADRVAQISSFSFDAVTFEIWGVLLNGATLVMIPGETVLSPVDFAAYIQQHNITVFFVTTALFNQYAQEIPGAFRSVKCLLFGGEMVEPKWVKKVLDAGGPQNLLHVYGPTESTTFASWHPVRTVAEKATTIPIGKAVSHTQLYVLNDQLQPVPPGITGEIYISGAGLALGYLNRPELTASKFITNHFTKQANDYLYKTGDLARRTADGNIEFIGRIDSQLKIRGFRVEPAEIETVLQKHSLVNAAIVRADQQSNGEKRLTAYIATGADSSLSIRELRSFLQSRLPEFMIPAHFNFTDQMPLTPNGKIDRTTLLKTQNKASEVTGDHSVPRNETERILTEIWAIVLGVEKPGIHDNFFELGGDSILIIQIVSKARQQGLKIRPKQLFKYQTIAELANAVNSDIQAGKDAIPEIHPATRDEAGPGNEIPLTPIQHWFFEQNFSEPHHWNQAIMLKTRQVLNPALLEQTVQCLIEHHAALRFRFKKTSGGWRQLNEVVQAAVPFEWVDLSAFPEEAQILQIKTWAAESQASLSLPEGTLLRVVYFDCGADKDHYLLIVIHHLVIDGVSWRILLADFQTVYRQLEGGKAAILPAKTTSFQQWAERLTGYVQSKHFAAKCAYWLSDNYLELPRLPVDLPGQRDDNTVAAASKITISLDAEDTAMVLRKIPEVYSTQINDVLLTALAHTFTAWTGDDTLVIDLESHGRADIFADTDLSRTVGWFTALFPVGLKIDTALPPWESLKVIKEQLRKIPDLGIGYGLLRYFGKEGAAGKPLPKWPQPEVSFNYLGQFDRMLGESPLFNFAEVPTGPARSLAGKRAYLIEIDGIIINDCLKISWTYCKRIHRDRTIKHLAKLFLETLQSLINHSRTLKATVFTPSDFPDVDLDQEALDRLVAQVNQKE